MLIGPYVNGAAIVAGGVIGATSGKYLPERVKASLSLIFGLCSMGLGVMLIPQVKNMPAVVIALVLGTVIGELIFLEKGFGRAAGSTRGMIDKFFPTPDSLSKDSFTEKFVAIVVLFCASGTGIFGAMHEGMTGDPSILYIKTVLDLFTSTIFASLLGFAVATIVIPQLVIQLVLAMLAGMILPMTTASMMADFSAVGGLLMLATGFRIAGIKVFPVANMLPALILVMPLSWVWATFVG
ncbi:DUF554 domain-containing protein [Klebsiella sp. I138]|uniref:DUF554 domain-containing protein n=1 Tax=Klebsiella sp. I138 TaxID=2755385 RepID=UPI003DAA0A23